MTTPTGLTEPVAWIDGEVLSKIEYFDGTVYGRGGFDDAVPLYAAAGAAVGLGVVVLADMLT